MSQVSAAIEIHRLTKSYRSFNALDGLTLSIPERSLFGLLGPNGAGKTTLLRTLLGFIKPSSGTAKIFGNPIELDSVSTRALTSYLPAEAKLFRMMRGSAVLKMFSELHPKGNIERSNDIAERLNLDTSRIVGFMSTGMRQKLAIACVLGVKSPLVILDEPTANLDPNVRAEVLKLIREVHQSGSTVIFSSHLLDEVETLCDRAAIIRSGKVVHLVDFAQLRATYRIVTASHEAISTPELPGGIQTSTAASCEFHVDVALISLDDALRFFGNRHIKILHIEPLGLKAIYETCSAS